LTSGPPLYYRVDRPSTLPEGEERDLHRADLPLKRTYLGRRQNYTGQHFWARGYFVSTVGRDEAAVREYIQHQELEDKRSDQLNMWKNEPPVGGSR
jgi:hypothetical protein